MANQRSVLHNQEVHLSILKERNITLHIKREDLIHPFISGNKYRKLKYNITQAKQQNAKTILTFGGAFSNHIAATAYAAKASGLRSIGVIRGEEVASLITTNPTLTFARECGMQFEFVSREAYRNKDEIAFIKQLKERSGDFFLIPEGGTNQLAIKGCEEILDETDVGYSYIAVAVGTGGTISGLINSAHSNQQLLGFPALKGDFLKDEILKFANNDRWKLVNGYHFGGYAKVNEELISFINDFKKQTGIPLDPVYTGKMLFGLLDMIKNDVFEPHSKILVIHTGGLQGIKGMNERLKKKKLPLIDV